MESFYLLTLGCPKNEVDSECLHARLLEKSFHFEADPWQADFLLVNTCAFIEAAKREAIEAILDLAEVKAARKKQGEQVYLIVCGCLSQRYAKEIQTDLPEVDLSVGTAEYADLPIYMQQMVAGENLRLHEPGKPGSLRHFKPNHLPSSDRSFAYLKISEGCNHGCAYCAIPKIRGPLRSRSLEEIQSEAEQFARLGYQEIILVAQDTGHYGRDLYGESKLIHLLKNLLSIPSVRWLRMMYLYAESVTEELIDLMVREPRLLPYFDIPIQHAAPNILKAMRRPDRAEDLEALFKQIRQRLPEATIRTTVLVGFPGESQEDYIYLKDFVTRVRFDRLGCFAFSAEEGTIAYRMSEQIEEDLKEARAREIMALQKDISLELNRGRIGQTCEVLLEGVSDDGLFWLGRSTAEAPEVDGRVFVAAQKPDLAIGQIIRCKIVDADAFDLTAISL